MIDVSAWPGLTLVEPLPGGHRNEVWRGRLEREPVAVRRSRRSAPSLTWELDLLSWLDGEGFTVPTPMPTADGRASAGGVVVQRWIGGRPPTTDDDWRLVADELQQLHRVGGQQGQRPGAAVVTELGPVRRSIDADLDTIPREVVDLALSVFAEMTEVPVALIHGDPNADNLRLTDHGTVGLLDWDESRVDLVWHDLSNLGVPVLDPAAHHRAKRLSDAWEAINAWTAEPAYARRRLARLAGDGGPG